MVGCLVRRRLYRLRFLYRIQIRQLIVTLIVVLIRQNVKLNVRFVRILFKRIFVLVETRLRLLFGAPHGRILMNHPHALIGVVGKRRGPIVKTALALMTFLIVIRDAKTLLVGPRSGDAQPFCLLEDALRVIQPASPAKQLQRPPPATSNPTAPYRA